MSFKINDNNNNNNNQGKKIVRILGHGQFIVDNNTLDEINKIDNSIVKLLENEEKDDSVRPEFKRQLKLLDEMVTEKGMAMDSREIVRSDIVLPGKDLTLEEARKVFKGEGIIKDIY
jgi:PspAA-like protein